jgi:quinol-cytochrome oxidoreductase complex cytochrome b subunit
MDTLRKVFGFIWMAGAVFMAVLLPWLATVKLTSSQATQEDYVFWIIIVTIFIPIIVGFMLFGFYAYKGEYNDREISD